MADYRRANYLALAVGRNAPDWLNAKYVNLSFIVPPNGTFTVNEEFSNNLPGIADAVLGDYGLWWAIGMYNGILDPLADIVTGTVLKIPNLTELLNYLDSEPTSSSATNTVTL